MKEKDCYEQTREFKSGKMTVKLMHNAWTFVTAKIQTVVLKEK